MPKRYHPKHKQLALDTLDANDGSITYTSLITGIPERTLRDWRKQRALSTLPIRPTTRAAALNARRWQNPPVQPPPTAADPHLTGTASDSPEADAAFLDTIRQQLVAQAREIAAAITDDLEYTPMHLRVLTLMRLLDRIKLLDAQAPNQTIRFEFQYPDGTIADVPPWHIPETQDSLIQP